MSEHRVKLPIGLPIAPEQGAELELIREVTVRKFGGQDKVDTFGLAKRNPVEAGTEFIRRVIIEPKLTKRQVHEHMTTADRDIVMLESYRQSKGDIIEWQAHCRFRDCREENRVPVDLGMVELKMADDGVFSMVDMDKSPPEMRYEINLEDVGIGMAELKYPTAKELEAVRKLASRNELEATYQMYSLCLRKWGDDDGRNGKFKKQFLQSLEEVQVLDAIEKRLDDFTFGLERFHTFDCVACGRSNRFILDMLSFLFLNPLLQ